MTIKNWLSGILVSSRLKANTARQSYLKNQKRHEMSKGVKHDQGKIRVELFPPEALMGISQILTFGATKYTDRNWEQGMSWGRLFGATMRHLWAWWGGSQGTTKNFAFGDLDEETKMSHLWHAGCCIVFLITYEERGIGDDDRSKKS